MNPSTSVYAVLICGNLLGGIVKGITGFGSAIIVLSVWVIFATVGIHVGSLRLAVLTESLGNEVSAIPLLVVTDARHTCDFRLATVLAFFSAVGSPLGAAMLVFFDPRRVEFVMACTILLVILVHCKPSRIVVNVYSRVWGMRKGPDGSADKSNEGDVVTLMGTVGTPQEGQLTPDHGCPAKAEISSSCCLTAEANFVDVFPAASSNARPDTFDVHSAAHGRQYDQAGSLCHIGGPPPLLHSLVAADAQGLRAAISTPKLLEEPKDSTPACANVEQDVVAAFIPGDYVECEGEEDRPLLPVRHQEDHFRHDSGDDSQHRTEALCVVWLHPSTDPPTAKARCYSSLRPISVCKAWVSKIKEQFRDDKYRSDFLRITGFGSLAGMASGIMAGMTGMGGPPIMYMYERLQVPKDVIRGTNAITNIFQVRIVAYFMLGAFRLPEWPLYVAAAVAAAAGMLCGSFLARFVEQRAFSRWLICLMLLCCGLLFEAAAGLLSHDVAD